jgi:nitric oxide reductase activation protein
LTREAVVVQALLVRHGELDRTAFRRLRRTSTVHRYFGFEVGRGLALGSPVPLVGLLAESLRAHGAVSTSAQESLDWARERRPGDPTPQHWGTLIPASVRRDPPAEPGNLGADPSDGDAAENATSKGDTAENQLADAAPEKDRTDMFTLVARRIRNGTKGRRKGDGSGTMLDGWSSGATSPLGAAGESLPPAPSESDSSRNGATLHPEWDVRRGAYRADWCRVREQPVPQRQNVTVTQPLPDRQLRSGMARLARSLARVYGQREGDDIDLDAVIDRQVSRRAGHHRDHGVHVARLRIKPELTVMVLMDASSSTAEPLRDGRTVFDEQRTAATALIDAMAAVGLSTAWWTFRSQGRHAVSVEQVKAFDQSADYDMHARAAALRPSGFTRLGAAIRHAAKAIDARAGAGHRLLLVLSDGVAFDHGYEGNHADSDARMALREARNRQIGCLSLSVGVEHDETRLMETFGANDYLRFRSWDAMRGDLAPLLRAAIRASG